MSFTSILVILLCLMILNKILNRLLKHYDKRKKHVMNLFNLNIEDDFDHLVKKYINIIGYKNYIENNENEYICYNAQNEVVLITHKKVIEKNKYIEKEEIINFIADMKIKSVDKGVFITNGKINKDIKEQIKKNNVLNIEFIYGTDLIIELKKIKLKQVKDLIKKEEFICNND